ncbi:MAG: phosphatase PAP2 family protein [Polyangiaceae bacterium]
MGPDAPHAYNRTPDRVSDVTGAYGGAAIGMLAGLGLEIGYFEAAGVRGAAVYAQRTALVDLESVLFTRGVVDGLKRLTGRCRPRYFVDGACVSEVRDAFPSGHTAPMGALAASRLVIAAQSSGPWEYRWGAFGISETLAIATAVLRVKAGMHSWSDVAGGFLIGHAVGALVALAHPMQAVDPADRREGAASSAIGRGGFGLTWSGAF